MEDDVRHAVKRCDSNLLAEILKSNHADLNISDMHGSTYVHTACKNADTATLVLLLEMKAWLDIVDEDGMAPIHCAVQTGIPEVVACLLAYGADVNTQNATTGMTPIHYTMQKPEYEERMVYLLMSHGADPNIHNTKGEHVDTNVRQTTLHAYWELRQILKNNTFSLFGRLVSPSGKISFKNKQFRLNQKHIGDVREDSFVYLRAISLAFLNMCSGGQNDLIHWIDSTDGKVVSDVFECLTLLNDKEFDLELQLTTKVTQFDQVFIMVSDGNRFLATVCDTDDTNPFSIVRTRLRIQEPMKRVFAYFVAIMESAVEKFELTEGLNKVASDKVKNFAVEVPKGMPKSSTVELKIVPTNEVHHREITEEIPEEVHSVSNFFDVAVKTEGRQYKGRDLSLTFPVHQTTGSVMRGISTFRENTKQEWEKVGAVIDTVNGTATLFGGGPGRFIVVENDSCDTDGSIPGANPLAATFRVTSKSIFERISIWLKKLYSRARRKEKYIDVKFYAMTKYTMENVCSILIGFERINRFDDAVNKWKMDEFQTERALLSSVYHVAELSDFEVAVTSNTAEVIGAHQLPLKVESVGSGHQLFYVQTKKPKNIAISSIQKVVYTAGPKQKSTVTQFCISLKWHRSTDKGDGDERQIGQFEKELSEALSLELGADWMMIGVLMEISCNNLEELSERNHDSSCRNMLILRQTLNRPNTVDVIDRLVHAFRLVEREDLIAIVDDSFEQLMTEFPNQRLCGVYQERLEAKQKEDDDKKDARTRFSNLVPRQPRHELLKGQEARYIVALAQMLGTKKDLLVQLGLQQNVFEEIFRGSVDPKAAMFKCLLRARQRYNTMASFLNDVITALESQQDKARAEIIKEDLELSRAGLRKPRTR